MLAALLGSTLFASASGAADRLTPPIVAPLTPANPALPIDLDAAFSEFDRRNNRLIFRQLNISQGDLAIKADEATADPADFDNSLWIFTGNVVINNGGTQTNCARAELSFRNNRLRLAVLTGEPARFTQAGTDGRAPTEGRGERLVYDLDAATIVMTTNAFLSDGKNQISGNSISYDLGREVVRAGGKDGGQVRMRITPESKPVAPETSP